MADDWGDAPWVKPDDLSFLTPAEMRHALATLLSRIPDKMVGVSHGMVFELKEPYPGKGELNVYPNDPLRLNAQARAIASEACHIRDQIARWKLAERALTPTGEVSELVGRLNAMRENLDNTPSLPTEAVMTFALHHFGDLAWLLSEAAARLTALEAELKEAVEVVRPFAAVADNDIGEDEVNEDTFRPISRFNRAKMITVGDLRRASSFMEKHDDA